MATINSVLGPMDTSDLGFTLTHEHILSSAAGFRYTYPQMMDRGRVEEVAVEQLTRAHDAGVVSVIDCTTADLDRDVRLMETVSRRSGVNMVCSTGCHLFVPHMFYPTMFEWMPPMPADDIASLWVKEIEEGIEDTRIKAGIIKIATNDPIRPEEELMLRAGARTQIRTGVPITTHIPHTSLVGENQIRILEEEGADLSKVYIGHVNSTLDASYHKRMMDKGVWLGMDHFFPGGPPGTPTWQERTTFISNLVSDGYQDRIMLGHDWNVSVLASSPTAEPNPDGYSWISISVIPLLREVGVSDQAIDRMMVENPRRLFEGTGH